VVRARAAGDRHLGDPDEVRASGAEGAEGGQPGRSGGLGGRRVRAGRKAAGGRVLMAATLKPMTEIIDICPVSELPPGGMRLVEWEDLEIAVFNCKGEILAIEDRCSHDNGPLVEGELDQDDCTI